jgi:hypothetical protein
MTPDRIDALAEELFAAAREERPGRELTGRVERLIGNDAGLPASTSAPQAAVLRAPQGEAAREPPRRRVPSRWLAGGLAAALVCGAAAALLVLPSSRDDVIMSAERVPTDAALRGEPPASEGEAAGERLAGAPVAAPTAAAPTAAAPMAAAHGQAAPPAASSSLAPAPASPAPASGTASRARPSSPSSSASSGDPGAAPTAPMAASGSSEPAPAAAASLASELAALKQIRQALRNHDGRAALSLLDRYDTGIYGASLSLEARVLRVEALDASGRAAEAEALARRFVRENPDSPLAERAQRFIDRTASARPGAVVEPP